MADRAAKDALYEGFAEVARAGLVTTRRDGTRIFYALAKLVQVAGVCRH